MAYEVDGYLSPFFSPLIHPDWMPTWFSPAILILWIPLGFRTTCYYYRKAYYRSYFADPPACAVGEPTVHKKYRMETAFPFILQNLHRFFLYLAFVPLFFLWLDAILSLQFNGGGGSGWGRLSCSSTPSCCRAIRCPATRSGTSSAATWTASRAAGGPRSATSCGAGRPG